MDLDGTSVSGIAPPLDKLGSFEAIANFFYYATGDLSYKGWLPLASVFRIVEASSDTPWWFVAPALGKTDHEAYYQKPSPAQTEAMMHLALAYGVDGFLFFAFQNAHGFTCFVDQQSLEPTDGGYAAAAKVAGSAHVCIEGIESEALLYLLERGGVCASAGSSCRACRWNWASACRCPGKARAGAARSSP